MQQMVSPLLCLNGAEVGDFFYLEAQNKLRCVKKEQKYSKTHFGSTKSSGAPCPFFISFPSRRSFVYRYFITDQRNENRQQNGNFTGVAVRFP